MLGRERARVLAEFAAPDRLLTDPAAVRGEAERWLESYRKHYLAWHERVQAPARYEELSRVRRGASFEAALRLARLGVGEHEARALAEEVQGALQGRCFAGDPLPAGCAVCPQCGCSLGEERALPVPAALSARVEALVATQLAALRQQGELFTRRRESCREQTIAAAVKELLATPEPTRERLLSLLNDPVLAWLRAQMAQPHARQVRLSELRARLEGKQLTAREVRRAVEEWLGGGEDEVVEIV